MDRKRALALWPLAALFLATAASTYKLSETESRSRARRAWIADHAAQTRELGYDEPYARDDAAVYALSQFMDQDGDEFAAALNFYQRYESAPRARLAKYTCSAIMDWARSPKLTPAHHAAAEAAVCDLITEYVSDPTLIGPLFGAAMELRLGDNAYLRHIAHEYVDDPKSNRQTAEFIAQYFLANPMARPAVPPAEVASTQ